MFEIDKWQEIFNSIRKHKLRTALTAFGIFWGIFMLALMMGSGSGLKNGTMNEFGKWATNSLFVWTQPTTMPYKGMQPGRRYHMVNSDVDAIKSQIKEIKYLSPRLYLSSDKIVRKNKEGAFTVRGESPDLIKIEPVRLETGRFINPIDLEQKRKIIVIGKRVREVLFEEDENPIGQYINVKGVYFLVVGISKSIRSGDDGREDNESIYMPITTMQQTFNMPNMIGWFVCTVQDDIKVSSIEDKVKAIIAERHKVNPEDKQAVGSFNLENEFLQFRGLFMGINTMMWLVSIGTILAGVVGVGNIMMITVKERTREIGIRKAMGATPLSIIALILQESIMITAFSGYLGLIAGVALVSLFNKLLITFEVESQFFMNPEVNAPVAITALVILVVTGTIAGLIPAIQAARVNPAITLKEE